MRTILLFALGLILSLSNLKAQDQSVWTELEQFTLEHLSQAIPEEAGAMANSKAQRRLEQAGKIDTENLRKSIRQAYWEQVFIDQNQERFRKEGRQQNETGNRSVMGGIPNPDFVDCIGRVAILIDQSSSLSGPERINIRNALSDFVTRQVGTGSSVVLIGMGSNQANSEPTIISPLIIYDANTPNANTHLDWINNELFEQNGSQSDSWSSGLFEVIGINVNLVIIITNGNDGHLSNEASLICSRANQLKTNGTNNGTGAHFFVYGQNTGITKRC